MFRRVQFSPPMTPWSRVPMADGSVMTAREAAGVIATAPGRIGDDVLAGQVFRCARGELVLPGADRWAERVASASPAAPVMVPALDRNARVVELEVARDALADPWHPSRFMESDGVEVSVLGAASREWCGGPVEFDVFVDGAPVRYRLTERDRRRFWQHLTGLVRAMRLESPRVVLGDDSGGGDPASAGIVGPGAEAAYVYEGEPAERVWVREDGEFRADQNARTLVAEHHARLLCQWRAEVVPPSVDRIVPVEEYDAAGGIDDLAESVRSGAIATALAIGAGAAAAVGAVVVAASSSARGRVRSWLAAGGAT